MKKNVIYLSILFVTLFMVSCSESFLDVNTDTNSPTSAVVEPELILPGAQWYTAETMFRDRYTNTLGNMFMYNWSQSDGFSWYNDEFLYNITSSFYDQIWDLTYRNCLKQYAVLRSYTGDEYVNYRAIGKIMESFHFQILVDIYGDIPYSEAITRGENPTPKYDDAQEVYAGIIATLDEAMMMIDEAGATARVPGDDDITFGGDMAMWKVFANTIKLRVLVRQGGGDFSGMTAIGFMTDNVFVQPGYLQEENRQSPMWDNYGLDPAGGIINNNDATCASDFILEYLQDRNDPRIDFIYEKPATGHLGVFQGLLDYDSPVVDQFEPSKVSNLGPGILKSPGQPAGIFMAADSYFLQAEAIQRGYITGDAKAAYESGIQASFDYLGAGSASTYYGQPLPLVGWNNSPDKLEAIITQKWLALNSVDAVQSWFDYSRTGFPSNLPISALASTSDRPVRLFYPASEVTSNNANVPSQLNAFTDKIFWAN